MRVTGSDFALRVSAPPRQRLSVGDRVELAVPAAACVPLGPAEE